MSNLTLRLAVRFLNSKRYGALARFMSIASNTGIAAGVCALIIGLSAMNGFEYELSNRVLSLVPAASLTSRENAFKHIEEDLRILRDRPGVAAAAPAVTLEGVFSHGQNFAPAALIGIDPLREREVISLERFMDREITVLSENPEIRPLIAGHGILKKLGLKPGDTVDLITIDKRSSDNPLSQPASAGFTIAGVFKTGGQIDSALAFAEIGQAAAAAALPAPNTIHLKTTDMLQPALPLIPALENLPDAASLSTWIETQGKLYNDIQLIRHILYLALVLVMAVACFNIVSNLVMSVSEKSREIAILLTMGMKRKQVVSIFTLMGILSGLKGTVIGAALGSALSLLITPLTVNFEKWFGFQILNENIYFISFIPARLNAADVLSVCLCSVVMSFLAALFPAFKASKIEPARELSL